MYDKQQGELTFLGVKRVNVNFRVREKSILVLEKYWKSPGNLFLKKDTNTGKSVTKDLLSENDVKIV